MHATTKIAKKRTCWRIWQIWQEWQFCHNRQQGKAQSNEVAHKNWRYWRIWQIWQKWQFCHNRQKAKAQSNEGAHKSWRYWRNWQIWTILPHLPTRQGHLQTSTKHKGERNNFGKMGGYGNAKWLPMIKLWQGCHLVTKVEQFTDRYNCLVLWQFM